MSGKASTSETTHRQLIDNPNRAPGHPGPSFNKKGEENGGKEESHKAKKPAGQK